MLLHNRKAPAGEDLTAACASAFNAVLTNLCHRNCANATVSFVNTKQQHTQASTNRDVQGVHLQL